MVLLNLMAKIWWYILHIWSKVKNDILDIIIINDDGFFVRVNYGFSERGHQGCVITLEIAVDDIDEFSKIINNFELVMIECDNIEYTREQLMGG